MCVCIDGAFSKWLFSPLSMSTVWHGCRTLLYAYCKLETCERQTMPCETISLARVVKTIPNGLIELSFTILSQANPFTYSKIVNKADKLSVLSFWSKQHLIIKRANSGAYLYCLVVLAQPYACQFDHHPQVRLIQYLQRNHQRDWQPWITMIHPFFGW